jgi:hypothetical protein
MWRWTSVAADSMAESEGSMAGPQRVGYNEIDTLPASAVQWQYSWSDNPINWPAQTTMPLDHAA